MDSPTKSKKIKAKRTPISIEQVFNHVSVVAATNVNPPPGRVLLTPRSAEVCLKLGVNPETMKIRDVDSFWEPGIDPTIQRMRHESYVTRRYDLMKQCRLERKKLINQHLMANAPALGAGEGGGVTALTPDAILEQQAEATSAMIVNEKKRMAKMQERQERELEQMLQYEVTRAKVQADMQKRIEDSTKKEELRLKQQEKRLKLMAEERRLREMQKVAQEEMEEVNRKNMAKAMYEKEKALQDRQVREAKEAKMKLKVEEAEKKAKQQEHKAQVQRYFAEEQMKLRQRLESMNGAEEKKQAAIRAKADATAAELLLKRAQADERIQRNMDMAKAVEEKRKTDFLSKQSHHEKLREEHLFKQERERSLHAQEVLLAEQRRRMILIQKRKEVEANAELMLSKFDDEEVHVQAVQAIRQKENDLLKEKSNLKRQTKQENVKRVERMTEYKRMTTLKKIEDVGSRVQTMMDDKARLLQDRREMAIKTKMQKEKIAGVMEEVRTNASVAAKVIEKAMTGNMSLHDIMNDKQGKKKKKKDAMGNSMASTKDMLSQSVPQLPNGSGDDYGDDFESTGDVPPQPHMEESPYDEDQGQRIAL